MSARKKKSWKKIIGVILFIILNAAVIAATAINEFGNSDTAAELQAVNLKWWLLIPAVGLFVIATLANVYKYVLMIRKSFPAGKRPAGKQIWETAWRVVMLGKYYDNITPAAVGGQPFQIYYMHKESELSSGHATSIPVFGMITTQIGFLILAIPCFIIGTVTGFKPALMTLAWLGLLFFAFWPVMVAGISYLPKQTTKFLQFCVRVLARVKIVKNREKALMRIESEVHEYAKSVKTIMRTRQLFLRTVILSTIYQASIMMIPFFVLTTFGGNVGFLGCFMTTLAVTSSVYFVPTPGNAGAAEGTFYLVFSTLSSGYVFWAMLVWRFFSYYIYIIIGPLIYIKMHLENRKKKPDEHKNL